MKSLLAHSALLFHTHTLTAAWESLYHTWLLPSACLGGRHLPVRPMLGHQHSRTLYPCSYQRIIFNNLDSGRVCTQTREHWSLCLGPGKGLEWFHCLATWHARASIESRSFIATHPISRAHKSLRGMTTSSHTHGQTPPVGCNAD